MSEPSKPGFDVFLSHNSKDKPTARRLKERLGERKLTVWLDEDELRPGVSWQRLLEAGIRQSRSVAVLVSDDGLGPWENEEMEAALRLAVKDGRAVIPVLLPGAPDGVELPLFLENRGWVDLRPEMAAQELDRLVWGITNEKPNRERPSGEEATKSDSDQFIEPKWSDELRIYGEGFVVRQVEPRETERRANVSVEFVTEISDNLNFMPLSPIYNREAKNPGEVPQLVGFLVVHNRGVSPVECNAFISVNSGMRDWPPQAVLAHWYGHDSDSIMIESGHSKKIIVAVLLEGSWFYRWMVPYRWQGDSFYAHTAQFFRSESAHSQARARISIKLKTDLPPVESLPLCSIAAEGREIREISNL